MRTYKCWSMLMVVMLIVGTMATFSSCSKDDKEEETKTEEKLWLKGTARSHVEYSIGELRWKRMRILEFNSDGTAMFYELYDTESVPFLKQETMPDGILAWQGTWTTLEGNPEWSYFNGTHHLWLSADINSDAEVVNPRPLTYTIDYEKQSVTIQKTTEDNSWYNWQGPFYLNTTPSKTFWSELRDEYGNLIFVSWDKSQPLDDSIFGY